jgi:hypothetical protein
MTSDLADKFSLFVEIHALEIRFVVGEDLVRLRDDPDLRAVPVSIPCPILVFPRIYMPRSCHPR